VSGLWIVTVSAPGKPGQRHLRHRQNLKLVMDEVNGTMSKPETKEV
jgi:hypothetical protein